MSNPNYRTASLPRANPSEVQAIVDLWKQKNPGKEKADFWWFACRVVNHWFPSPVDNNAESGTIASSVRGPFCAGAWCQEDVEKCREALK